MEGGVGLWETKLYFHILKRMEKSEKEWSGMKQIGAK